VNQYLLFLVNNQQFAIEIANINKIIDYVEPVKVPETAEYMLGVIELNEKILPVISLSQRLFGKENMKSNINRVIVLNWSGKQIGYVVEDIIGIKNFDLNQVEIANRDLEITRDYIYGYIKNEKDVIIILDNDKLFTGKHAEMLLDMKM